MSMSVVICKLICEWSWCVSRKIKRVCRDRSRGCVDR